MQILKDEIKEKIIKASKKMFKKDGYEATSMRNIAKEAGISTGNIYRYFITKKHLLDEIVNEVQEEIENFLNSVPSDYTKINHQELFNMLIDVTVNISKEKADELEILFNFKDGNEINESKDHIVKLVANKMKQLAKSVKEEQYDDTLCEAIAKSLFEGFAYIVKENSKDTEKLRENLNTYTSIMITGIDEKLRELAKKGGRCK